VAEGDRSAREASIVKRRPRSVRDVCIAKLGVHRGAIAAARVAQWAIATRELGHVPTVAEYSDWWALSERTGWYHASRIEAVFGDEWRDVVELVAREIDRRMSPRQVQRLTVVV
jgi:hypothetical protein